LVVFCYQAHLERITVEVESVRYKSAGTADDQNQKGAD